MAARERLDVLVVARGLAESREKAQRLIMAGEVFVDGQRMDKPGMTVPAEAGIEVRGGLPYASRGGFKLAHALDRFGITVAERVCADVGASTGGFTDVLLQRGAARVYAIDVGYGQLAWELRTDPRVVVMDRTNIRLVESLPEPASFACIDVSFISLTLVLPVVARLLTPGGELVALVKPQFEAGKGRVGKGGVVRDPAVHRDVLARMLALCEANGWSVGGLTASPIKGPAGNIEFLLHVNIDGARMAPASTALLDSALAEAEVLR
ncbi:MAG: TlyA family RNA methyltransferase [Chloroflexi bacterium]|nr:TlyA family RNA methyltransferase [Chloroflexota bacterium]